MADRREFTLSGAGKGKNRVNTRKPKPSSEDTEQDEEQGTRPQKKAAPSGRRPTPVPKKNEAPKRQTNDLFDDGDDDGDEDDELFAELENNGKKSPLFFVVCGVVVVLLVALGFLLFSGRKNPTPAADDLPPVEDTSGEQPETQQPAEDDGPKGLGAQDFTQNTTMTNSNGLQDPDEFVQDIHGLTTRVNYTVKSINYIADFVQYTKKRGTWGGGLELYWLDATYKDNHYVVQIPFQYYKELDEVGIIPVKMEVLTVQGSTADQNLTVISYMTLDENTLKDILKQQSKTLK